MTPCNRVHPLSAVCRLPLDHEGPHIPFSDQLVALNSVKVCAVERPML